MISLTNVGGADQAMSYFAADNYYTQDQGVENSAWFGEGAKMLSLSGEVDPNEFKALLQGKIEGQELGKWVKNPETGEKEKEHRAGNDITFSAPKSVSLLAEVAGRVEVRQAHEEAVKSTLTYIEKELAATREMRNGVVETSQTGNLIVGMFRHNTSRDLDPQTHTHAVIMNATMRDDGQWRSLHNDALYTDQKAIGAIYNSELASRLQKAGYELTRTDDKGNFEIKGISREQIEAFSTRRAEIEKALAEKGIDINNATPEQKEVATLATRSRKTEVNHDQLIGDWKAKASQVGIDFDSITQRAEKQRASGGVDSPDQISGKRAMVFAAAHLVEREAVVTKQELLTSAITHGVGRVSAAEVQKAFKQLEANGSLVKLPDGNYTTKQMLGSEKWALDQVRGTKGQTAGLMQPEVVAAKLQQAEAKQGFNYTQGQREAVVAVLTTKDRYVAVQGLAGTGKTTMLKSLREIAQDHGYTVRGMAPTGAASKVLAKETGMAASTVSTFVLKEQGLQRELKLEASKNPDVVRKPEVWIVDESSFLSQKQKAQIDKLADTAGAKVVYLGDTLQLQGVSAGKPFELAQKDGIETAYMTEISRQKTPELKAVVDIIVGRDKLAPGERLTEVRTDQNGKAFAAMDKAGMVNEIKGGPDKVLNAIVKDYLAMPAAERDQTIVITPYNKARQAINEGVREGLKEEGKLSRTEADREIFVSKGWTRAMTKEAQYYQPKDVVRFGRDYEQIDAKKGEYAKVERVDAATKTVYLRKEDGTSLEWKPSKHNKVEVYESEQRKLSNGELIRITRNDGEYKNGEIAKITAVAGDKVTMQLKSDATKTFEVDLGKNRHWDHAYASTVHASQGSTQKKAMFHIPTPEGANSHRVDKNMQDMAKVFGDRGFYVGVTRASHAVAVYTNDKEMAARAVEGKQDKTSAVEVIAKHEKTQEQAAQSKSTMHQR